MTYETTPGTLPHRALEYLKTRPAGTELSTAVFADIMGADIAGFSTTMANCLRAGLMKATTKPGNRRLLYWSLGNGVPLTEQSPDDDTDLPVQRIVPATPPTTPPIPKWTATVPTPALPSPDLGPKAESRKPSDRWFRITECSDGTMTIHQGGFVLELDQQETTMLCAFVGRRG